MSHPLDDPELWRGFIEWRDKQVRSKEMSDEWIGDVFERLQKDVPEKEWERLEMTLDDKALEAAIVAFWGTATDYIGFDKSVAAAITAYLAALPRVGEYYADYGPLPDWDNLPIPEEEVVEWLRMWAHAENGPPQYHKAWIAADVIIRQQRRIEILTEIGSDQQQEIERLKRASPAATEPAMTPEPTPQSSPDQS